MLERRFVPPAPFSFRSTLALLTGPTTRWVSSHELWRATRTPDGSATMAIRRVGDDVTVAAWGPGASWAMEGVPALLGVEDDPDAFRPEHPPLQELHRRHRGMRIGRTGIVMESLMPSILEQKVTGKEAFRSWRRIVRAFGEPAPGPLGLTLAPDPSVLAQLPSWRLHPFGVERKRAETLLRACASARRLEEAASMSMPDAYRRLQALRGIGPWTAAEVALVALGDRDAVSVGDYHLKNHVAWALAGEPRATDERMLELLAPYEGQRARAVRLIEMGAPTPPRFGPRVKLRAIERI